MNDFQVIYEANKVVIRGNIIPERISGRREELEELRSGR